MRVLLIGGAGYVGVPVAERLIKDGIQVDVLDSFIYGDSQLIEQKLINLGAQVHHGDFRDAELLASLSEVADGVVVLAGLVGDPIVRRYPNLAREINEIGLREATSFLCSRVPQLIFVSTCSNYGLIEDDELADEETPLKPVSEYSRAKVRLEQQLLDEVGNRALITIFRFATAFGIAPRMRFDLTVNEFAKELAMGRELVVFDPDTWRPYCHVSDFAEIISRAVRKPQSIDGQVINAGDNSNNFTKRQIAEMAWNLVGRGQVRYLEKGSDPRNYKVSFEKIRRLLDFQASRSVEDGLREVVSYVEQIVHSTGDSQKLDAMGNYVIAH